MRHRLPTRLVVVVTLAVAAIGVLVGILSDLGATRPWIVAAFATGVAAALIGAESRHRHSQGSTNDVLLVEAAFVVVVGVAAFFVAKTVTLSNSLSDAQQTARSAPAPRNQTFLVLRVRGRERP